MAPPVEEAPTKVVKVATTVVRRQSTMEGETKSMPSTTKDDNLHLSVLEESLLSSKYEGRYVLQHNFSCMILLYVGSG